MCANTLTFGILANIAENFSQGKIGLNFMPTFEDFSLWDDVVHPFFLSIGVYIASFGPLVAVGLVAIFMIVSPVSKEMNGLQSDAARTVNPELPYASRAAQQSEQIKELLKKDADDQKRRIEMMHDRENSVSEQVKSVEEGREVQPTQTNTAAVVKPEDTEESVERCE